MNGLIVFNDTGRTGPWLADSHSLRKAFIFSPWTNLLVKFLEVAPGTDQR